METVFNIIESLSIIIASIGVLVGISAWRRETRWKRKYELAEDVLSLFYSAEEAIIRIRSPFSFVNEGKTRKRSENERESESEILDQAFIVFERYQNEKDIFISLKKIKHRFRAIFGVDSIKPFNKLDKILKDIFISAQMLGRIYWQNQGKPMTDTTFEKHLKKMTEYEEVFWSGMRDPDPIGVRLETVINEIEVICESIIKKR